MSDSFWKYKILRDGIRVSKISSEYLIYKQTISFTQVGDLSCKIVLGDKTLILNQSRTIQINRIIPSQNMIYNAKLYYSYVTSVYHTINDNLDLTEGGPKKTNNKVAMDDIGDTLKNIGNKITTYTKDEIIGEIESLLNPSFS